MKLLKNWYEVIFTCFLIEFRKILFFLVLKALLKNLNFFYFKLIFFWYF